MISFTSASRELSNISTIGQASHRDSAGSAWFAESRCLRSQANAQCTVQDIDIHTGSDASDLDVLVADISALARSYLNRGDIHPTLAPAGLPRVPLNDGSEVHNESDTCNATSCTGGENTVMLQAVCELLGSALQRMRTSASMQTVEVALPVVPARPRGGIAPSALRRVREHIDMNLGEHIEISDLASLTGLSPCHFSRAFKQSMGMPPHRYLISRRVQEAARLIESTNRPLFEIALDVGFSDQSHFTRVFSSQLGESPSQFRHQRR